MAIKGALKETGEACAIYDRVVLKQRTTTSVSGVFAAGEVANGHYRQTATVVGDGCRAAVAAWKWLEGRDGTGRLRGT